MTRKRTDGPGRGPDETLGLILGAMTGNDFTWETATEAASRSLTEAEREELRLSMLVEEAVRKLEPMRRLRKRMRAFKTAAQQAVTDLGVDLDQLAALLPEAPLSGGDGRLSVPVLRSAAMRLRPRAEEPGIFFSYGTRGGGISDACHPLVLEGPRESPAIYLAEPPALQDSWTTLGTTSDEFSVAEREADARAGELLSRHVPMVGMVDINAICEEQGLFVLRASLGAEAGLVSNGDVGAIVVQPGLPVATERNLMAVALAFHLQGVRRIVITFADLIDYADAARIDANLLAARLLIPDSRLTDTMVGGNVTVSTVAADGRRFGAELVTTMVRRARLAHNACAALVTDEVGKVVMFVPSRTFRGSVALGADLAGERSLVQAWMHPDGPVRSLSTDRASAWLEDGAQSYRMQSKRVGGYVYSLLKPVR